MMEETEPLGREASRSKAPQLRVAASYLIQELHGCSKDLSPLVHLNAVEVLLQSQDLRPLRGCLGELAVERKNLNE